MVKNRDSEIAFLSVSKYFFTKEFFTGFYLPLTGSFANNVNNKEIARVYSAGLFISIFSVFHTIKDRQKVLISSHIIFRNLDMDKLENPKSSKIGSTINSNEIL